MARNVAVEEQDVRRRDPHGICQPQQHTVDEAAPRLPLGKDVGADQENHQPAHGLDIRGNHEHSSDGHRQAKQGKLKDQFPIHIFGFSPRGGLGGTLYDLPGKVHPVSGYGVMSIDNCGR